jgi:hypothetical protein
MIIINNTKALRQSGSLNFIKTFLTAVPKVATGEKTEFKTELKKVSKFI